MKTKLLIAAVLIFVISVAGLGAYKLLHAKPSDSPQYRLKWLRKNTIDAYRRIGHHNLAWDRPAERALELSALSRATNAPFAGPIDQLVADSCAEALRAGCDDPLILYFAARCPAVARTVWERAEDYAKAADALTASEYPPFRKFYARLRASAQFAFASNHKVSNDPKYDQYLDYSLYLGGVLADPGIPPCEVYWAASEALEPYKWQSADYENIYLNVEKYLASHPNNYESLLIVGDVCTARAWHARGTGRINTVSEEAHEKFQKLLAQATAAYERSWQSNSGEQLKETIAVNALNAELGQNLGREHYEIWFQRAMKVNPACYQACSSKLYYLEPKWYGSADEMLAFGRECLRNPNWKGNVPLIILDAHESLSRQLGTEEKTAYWHSRPVWEDVEAAFEAFFKVNPTWTGYRHNQAKYAYQCGRWEVFLGLVPELDVNGSGINYEYFGGEEAFKQMVATAKSHAKSKSAELLH